MPKNKEAKKAEKVKPIKVSQEEIEKKILDMSKKGITAEKIGEALRKEGIHTKEHGVKVSKVIKQKGEYKVPDVSNMETKLEKLKIHAEKNKQDKKAMRERERIFSSLRKLKQYHNLS